jgi:hypothetical protein
MTNEIISTIFWKNKGDKDKLGATWYNENNLITSGKYLIGKLPQSIDIVTLSIKSKTWH